ncbi:flavin reductase [Dyella sp. M7H15-1]|uniref:flavin reductase family protein n=1 Tax=Dyella sp. M7H15-1 TaxID=2501295 RepID=UPI0010051C6D|nr:flavin reductase family protein [Dyella sp. M7H15-1]QAU23001.1 flavin reductase [Dyella sp. M7H15-1]
MALEQKQYRHALGRFTTGVCVVSAVGEQGLPIGMTINSFSSLSLEPSLVQWSIKQKSLCYPLFSRLKSYSISVLSDQQMEISSRYARPGDHRMHPADYAINEYGMPYVKHALARFECLSWGRMEAGDHDLLIGIVDKFFAEPEGRPLVFFAGAYRPLLID